MHHPPSVLFYRRQVNAYLTIHTQAHTYTFGDQEEKQDEAGWTEPAGFHLIPLPFADDIRAAPVEEGCRGIICPNISLDQPEFGNAVPITSL
jgi:hypothetical protein